MLLKQVKLLNKMEGKQYNKLVRDNVPEVLDKIGIPYEQRILEEWEYIRELFKKLDEEVEEFIKSKSTEEFADVLQVIEAIKEIPEFEKADSITYEKTNLEEWKYIEELFNKLTKKVKDFINSISVEKFSDVLRIIDIIKEIPEFKDVEKIRLNKLLKKGGFEKRIMLKGIDNR
jgi:predicted house-cleaning noncanonical NTP pyrophosphatase (MazG superfamily)